MKPQFETLMRTAFRGSTGGCSLAGIPCAPVPQPRTLDSHAPRAPDEGAAPRLFLLRAERRRGVLAGLGALLDGAEAEAGLGV